MCIRDRLSVKSSLFVNLQNYSEVNKENVFNYLPITFLVSINPNKPNGQIFNAIHNFVTFYSVLESNKQLLAEKIQDNSPKPAKFDKQPNPLFPVTYDRRNTHPYSRYTMPLSHFAGHNLWLLKPIDLNRGQGIHVFHSVDALKSLIVHYCRGKSEDGREAEVANTFVIQKYVEEPLLIEGRKFDIRVWVLVTHEVDCYFFKEGYLRTSSAEYKIDMENLDNRFVHLTNNAVQKHSDKYGSFEDGNQMSFKEFQEYLDKAYPDKQISVRDDLVITMKNLVKKTILSTRKKLNSCSRKNTFELFGYDFIIDQEFNIWLIEVNTNPCLEQNSQLLKALIPRMLDDAFKLTLDCIFPPLPQYGGARRKYPVPNYEDDDNMW
eukprot:TRINITY_DN2679_c0_g1_i5.p1 TRINITY_DN2679_c0_g1~~TRINITY_DN2679_c0_g1_i5.p1  ORF type:complete len:378 (+),score=76.62 TRINITY_DN2679_c0_g1_i5:64-1197(+)